MTNTELPVFPGDRDTRCPFDPAPEYAEWRATGGLRKVRWQGHEVWAVSRYEDINGQAGLRVAPGDREDGERVHRHDDL